MFEVLDLDLILVFNEFQQILVVFQEVILKMLVELFFYTRDLQIFFLFTHRASAPTGARDLVIHYELAHEIKLFDFLVCLFQIRQLHLWIILSVVLLSSLVRRLGHLSSQNWRRN